MSRSGYSEDIDNWQFIKWRGQVASAIRGKRGQRLLRELADAMDAMPEKVLISNELEHDGCHCALGVVGKARGIDLSALDPEDGDFVASAFDVGRPLALEIVYQNDEGGWHETPEQRWKRMRAWVEAQLDSTANARD